MPDGMPPAKSLKMAKSKSSNVPMVGGGGTAGSLSNPDPIPFWVQNESYLIGEQVIFDNKIFYAKVPIPVGFAFDDNLFQVLSAPGGGDYIVDVNGTGTNTTIQAAITAAELRGGPASIRILGGSYVGFTITKPGISVSSSAGWSGVVDIVGDINIALTASGTVQLGGLEVTGKVECSGSENTLLFINQLSVSNSGGNSPMVLSNTNTSSTLIPSELRLTENGNTAPALDITSNMNIDEIIGGGGEYRRNGSSNSNLPAINQTGNGLLRLNNANILGQVKISGASTVLMDDSQITVTSGDTIVDTGHTGIKSLTGCVLSSFVAGGSIFTTGFLFNSFHNVVMTTNLIVNGTDASIYALKSAFSSLLFVEPTSGGELTAVNTTYDPDTNGSATFTLPTPTAALNGAERFMYRKGGEDNFITITGNICGIASQRIIGLIDEYYAFKCDGTTWRESGHSAIAFATLEQLASDTFSITTSFVKLDTWDTLVFSTPGRLTADLAGNEIDIIDFEGPAVDGYKIDCTLTFEYDNNQTVTAQIAVDGVVQSTPVSVNGLGSGKPITVVLSQAIGITETSSISIHMKAETGGTLTALTGRFTVNRIKA